MSGHEFRSGTLLHGLCLAVIVLLVVAFVLLARRHRDGPGRVFLERFVGGGCLVAWIINTAYWMSPSRFVWEQALPLHYCNMANLIGAVAVLTRRRFFQALIYFWALALCIWAFLTPTVRYGPGHGDFWIFWFYHGFIPLAVAHVLVVDRYRPTFTDLLGVMGFTVLYTLALVVIDNVWGWNYGFVGPGKPESTTLLDVLGPYPLRLLWIALLAIVLFLLCLAPWSLWRRVPRSD